MICLLPKHNVSSQCGTFCLIPKRNTDVVQTAAQIIRAKLALKVQFENNLVQLLEMSNYSCRQEITQKMLQFHDSTLIPII